MIITIANMFNETAVVFVVAAAIPPLLCLILWLFFYLRYDRNVLHLQTQAFTQVAKEAQGLPSSHRKNLATLDAAAADLGTAEFKAAWQSMMEQAKRRYSQDILPEAASFFKEEALLGTPGRRSAPRVFWGVFALLLCLALLFPAGTSALAYGAFSGTAVAWGLLSAIAVVSIHLIFVLMDLRSLGRAKASYQGFLHAFDRVLPTADVLAGPALILDATEKNQRAFHQTTRSMEVSFATNTRRITDGLDEFTKGGVLPALKEAMSILTNSHIVPVLYDIKGTLDQTMRTMVEKQENGIREFTQSFATNLADTLELRMGDLSKSLDEYQTHLLAANRLSEQRISDLNQLIEGNLTSLRSMMDQQAGLLDRATGTFNRAAQLQELCAENGLQLNRTTADLSAIFQKQQEESERLGKEYLAFNREYSEAQSKAADVMRLAQQKLEDALAAGMEQYNQISQLISGLMEGITDRMNEAMAGAGREIAAGVNQAAESNAQTIADLTEQAQKLRNDYDIYFGRIDESTKTTLEEMDYQIQGLITRITQEVGSMLDATVKENASILTQYKDQTVGLLQTFEEQAASISLYAKEINMDISDLSSTLRIAVSEFTQQIKEGISLSVSDFDRGFAELAERIANTVESISDAVESLPAALKRKE